MRIGLDIGGTKILGVVLATDGSIIAQTKVGTAGGPDGIIASATDVLSRLAVTLDGALPTQIGIGIPGIVDRERGAVRHFLGSMGYDTADEELMYNEMQAYIMFTYDPRFFLPTNLAMTEARRWQLQTAFLSALSDGWLKTALAEHMRQLREAGP